MHAVRENLNIIKQLLEAFNATQQRKSATTVKEKAMQADILALVNDLKSEIYPKIDDFASKAQVALQDYFDCLDVPFDVETAQCLLKLTQDEMDSRTWEKISRVIGGKNLKRYFSNLSSLEIVYVQQMKQLENSTSKIQNKDVVPISGLIVGRLYRYQTNFNGC
jgi:hypothetical protein